MLEKHHAVLRSCFRRAQSTRTDFLERKNGAVDPTTPLRLRERSIWRFFDEEKTWFLGFTCVTDPLNSEIQTSELGRISGKSGSDSHGRRGFWCFSEILLFPRYTACVIFIDIVKTFLDIGIASGDGPICLWYGKNKIFIDMFFKKKLWSVFEAHVTQISSKSRISVDFKVHGLCNFYRPSKNIFRLRYCIRRRPYMFMIRGK